MFNLDQSSSSKQNTLRLLDLSRLFRGTMPDTKEDTQATSDMVQNAIKGGPGKRQVKEDEPAEEAASEEAAAEGGEGDEA